MIQVLIFIFLIPIAALAQFEAHDDIDKTLNDCLSSTINTSEAIECYNEALDNWDERLNKVYNELKQNMNEEEQAALLDAQRKWLTFRDAEYILIDEIYTDKMGAVWPVSRAERRMILTKQRTLLLESLLHDRAEY